MTLVAAWLYLSALAMLLRLAADADLASRRRALPWLVLWPLTAPAMLGGELIYRLTHPKETAS